MKQQLIYNVKLQADEQIKLKEKSVEETSIKLATLQQHYKLLKIQFDDYKEECSNTGTQQLNKLNALRSEMKLLRKDYDQQKVCFQIACELVTVELVKTFMAR